MTPLPEYKWTPFQARFTYTHALVRSLCEIDAARALIDALPLPPDESMTLNHDAYMRSTCSSTRIEGITLEPDAYARVISEGPRTGREAEQEVRNYWQALTWLERIAEAGNPLSEDQICELHGIIHIRHVGRRALRSTYRTDECPVVEDASGRIVYGPPIPAHVPPLMADLAGWWRRPETGELHPVIRAGMVSYQFITVHPFNDGNGRTGRLLATAELWRSDYRMRGFLSFEEFFSEKRHEYYAQLQDGCPVNYYEGRHDRDLTPWLEYFAGTIRRAANDLAKRATALRSALKPEPMPWEQFGRRKQQILMRVLARFNAGARPFTLLSVGDIEAWFGVSAKTARAWLAQWVEEEFVEPVPGGSGQRIRSYRLKPDVRKNFFGEVADER